MIYLLGMGGYDEGMLLYKELLCRAERLIGSKRLIGQLHEECCPGRVICSVEPMRSRIRAETTASFLKE